MAHCGEKLIELLEGYGIDVVFGIPGVHTIELYRGLAKSRIRHVTPRHEQGAGFMADGYARATGRPAACFIISGPGMTNIATAMGEAYGDSIPMLVISSVNRTAHLAMAEGRLHDLDHQRALTAGVCAFSHTLMRPDELPRVLARAFAVFHSARPRPVHIEIPLDVLQMPADHIDTRQGAIPNRPSAPANVIADAVQALRSAQRPVLFIGGGAVDAQAEVRRLVAAFEVPTAVTVNGRGLLPKDYPHRFGIYFTLPELASFITEADLLVAVGTELGEPDYGPLFDEPGELAAKLVRIDIDPEQLSHNRAADVAICGDATETLRALNDALSEGPPIQADTQWLARLRQVQDATDRFVQAQPEMQLHLAMFEAIDRAFDDPILVGDNAQPVFTSNYLVECESPRSYFNSGTGYCTLGYAMPAAIGAKIGQPDRPVVCISGDGGFMFTLAELACAVQEHLPIIVVVWNNLGYREIRKFMVERDVEPVGVALHTPDFALLAQAFACEYKRVATLVGLESALKHTHPARGPVIIEIDEQKLIEEKQGVDTL